VNAELAVNETRPFVDLALTAMREQRHLTPTKQHGGDSIALYNCVEAYVLKASFVQSSSQSL
jgi:hypothetical protein